MRRKLKHTLSCAYTICDIYFRIFKKLTFVKDYRFFIRNCIFCKLKKIIAKYKLLTIEIRILSINRDKIRKVVSLIFLNFLQKIVNSQLYFQNLFDFAFEISSNKTTHKFS